MIRIVLLVASVASALPDACPPPPRHTVSIWIGGGDIDIDSVWRDDGLAAILDREGPPVSIDEAIDRILHADAPSTDEPGLDVDPHLTDQVRTAVTPSPDTEGGSIQ